MAWLKPTLTANAPATPVSAPLEPEVASALKVSTLSPATSGTRASTTSPSAVTVTVPGVVPTSASLVTRATFTATAMPTPVPVGPPPVSKPCPVPVPAPVRSTNPSAAPAFACSTVSYSLTLLPSTLTKYASPSVRPPIDVPAGSL